MINPCIGYHVSLELRGNGSPMQDFAYFKSLYPAACKQMQLCVEAVCDELEYEGSPIYDEYPDRIFLEKLTKRALEKWQKVYPAGTERTDTLTNYIKAADVGTVSTEEGTAMVENSLKIDSPGGEREENLAGTSIQPHLPEMMYGMDHFGANRRAETLDIWWEADEPNLTAQERRPWSPPPGPRPGRTGKSVGTATPAAGTASGRTRKSVGDRRPAAGTAPGSDRKSVGTAAPPPGPRPGGPGNPWGPPPPPPGPRPGGPGNPWGPPPPPPGPRPGRPGNPWGAPLQDFLQVLLMNELQERRRCRKC